MNNRNSANRRGFLKTTAVAGIAGAEFLQASRQSLAEAVGALFGLPSMPRLDADGEVRIGLIGCDRQHDLILNSIPSIPGARLTAVALNDGEAGVEHESALREGKDRRAALGEIQAHPVFHQRTRIYEAYQEMLSWEDLDVAVACLPSGVNAQASLAAVRSGCHLIAGKPLATDLESLADLVSLSRERKVEITTMLPLRHHPGVAAVRTAVAEGLIGEPLMVFAQKPVAGNDELELPGTHDVTGKQSFPWVGVHPLDILSYSTGRQITQASVLRNERAQGSADDTEELPGILLKLSNNATGIVSLNCLPAGATTHSEDRLRVAGTEGVITMNGERVEITTRDGAARNLPLVPCPSMLESFVAFLRGQASPVVAAEEAFNINRLWLTVRKAGEESRPYAVTA